MTKQYREVFKRQTTNSAQLNAGSIIAFEYQKEAEKNKNLPHNLLVIANQNTSCTLYVYLDDVSNQDTPSYIIFPSQILTVPVEDGATYTTVFVKNTHGANNVSAKEIKVKIATVRVSEVD